MGITQFEVTVSNKDKNVEQEPVQTNFFFGALIYLFKFYYKSKKEGTNIMTDFHIRKIRLG